MEPAAGWIAFSCVAASGFRTAATTRLFGTATIWRTSSRPIPRDPLSTPLAAWVFGLRVDMIGVLCK